MTRLSPSLLLPLLLVLATPSGAVQAGGPAPDTSTPEPRATEPLTPVTAPPLGGLAEPAVAPGSVQEPTTAEPGPKADGIPPATGGPPRRPRIGLVLSGGGARGGAHLGVLEVLEELQVPVDVVVGTSMGSIIGGLYASGLSPEQIRDLLGHTDWDDALSDVTPLRELPFRRKLEREEFLINFNLGLRGGRLQLPRGLLQGQKLSTILKSATWSTYTVEDFDRLPVPFRAVATNIATGERVVLDHGDLATAMRASMSVPGVFSPVTIDGQPLVDGGIVDNMPVDVARELGVDVILAVDISSPLLHDDQLTSYVSIVNQVVAAVIQWNVTAARDDLGPQDVLLNPELDGISSAAFDRVLDAADQGYKAADAMRATLGKLSVGDEEWARYLASHRMDEKQAPIIDEIVFQNDSRLSNQSLRARMDTREGEPLDLAVLDEDIRRLYGLDIFSRVDFTLVERGDRTRLVIRANQKPWGPTYLRFSTRLESNLGSRNGFTIGANILTLPLDASGAEWRSQVQFGSRTRLFTEYYKPLDARGEYFVSPNLLYNSRPFITFAGAQPSAEYRAESLTTTLGIGREYTDRAQLRGGILFETGDIQLKTGSDTAGAAGPFQEGGLFLAYGYDSFDETSFPSLGTASVASVVRGMEALGSDADYTLGTVGWNRCFTYGNNTFVPGFDVQATLEGERPVHSSITRGGFLNLSGFPVSAVGGQQSALARLLYYHRFGAANIPAAKRNLYLGGSLEAGGLWSSWKDVNSSTIIPAGSVFAGMRTIVGPLYVGYGFAESGNDSFFFVLGRAF